MRKLGQLFLALVWVAMGYAIERKSIFSEKYNDVTLAQKLKEASVAMGRDGKKFIEAPKDYHDTFYSLEKSVAYTLKHPTPILLESLVRFAGELALLDNSGSVGRLLLPLWDKHRFDVLRYTELLAVPQRKALKAQIKTRLEERKRGGNG